MAIALLIVQLVLCLVVLQREVVRGAFANFASSIFFIGYTLVYVVEPLVLHVFFGGPSSIVAVPSRSGFERRSSTATEGGTTRARSR